MIEQRHRLVRQTRLSLGVRSVAGGLWGNPFRATKRPASRYRGGPWVVATKWNPGLWLDLAGNQDHARILAARMHRDWLIDGWRCDRDVHLAALRMELQAHRADLTGCDLACWCDLRADLCHADTLLRFAYPSVVL